MFNKSVNSRLIFSFMLSLNTHTYTRLDLQTHFKGLTGLKISCSKAMKMTVDKTYRENIFRNSNMYTTMIQS